MLLSGLYPFSTLNPDCFLYNFEIVHDISFLLADGTIMYDVFYTNDVILGALCIYYQDSLVLPVLLCDQ